MRHECSALRLGVVAVLLLLSCFFVVVFVYSCMRCFVIMAAWAEPLNSLSSD